MHKLLLVLSMVITLQLVSMDTANTPPTLQELAKTAIATNSRYEVGQLELLSDNLKEDVEELREEYVSRIRNEIATMAVNAATPLESNRYGFEPIDAITYSLDGKQIVSVRCDHRLHQLRLWNDVTRKFKWISSESGRAPYHIAFRPNTDIVSTRVSSRLKIRDRHTGELELVFFQPPGQVDLHLYHAAISPDGNDTVFAGLIVYPQSNPVVNRSVYSCASDGTSDIAVLYECDDVPHASIGEMKFTVSGAILGLLKHTYENASLLLVNSKSGELLTQFQPVARISDFAFSGDSTRVAIATSDAPRLSVQIWDLKGNKLSTLAFPCESEPAKLTWHPYKQRIAVGCSGGSIHELDLPSILLSEPTAIPYNAQQLALMCSIVFGEPNKDLVEEIETVFADKPETLGRLSRIWQWLTKRKPSISHEEFEPEVKLLSALAQGEIQEPLKPCRKPHSTYGDIADVSTFHNVARLP